MSFQLTKFEEFVMSHRDYNNLAYHFISTILAFLVILLGFTYHYYWLFLVPVTQYIGVIGHLKYEPIKFHWAAFVSPFTTIYLVKIFYLVATNKYKEYCKTVLTKKNLLS